MDARNNAPGDERTAAAPGAEGGLSKAIVLEGEMARNLKFEPVSEEHLPRLLTVTGKVHFNEDQTARVLAPLPGQVAALHVRVGDRVERDQVLLEIRSREVASLVAECLENRRDLDLAEKTHNMTKDLFAHQAASRISVQQSESELEKAKARFAQAAEAVRIYGIDPAEVERGRLVNPLVAVRSPLRGSVIERAVTTGQYVQPESGPLLILADLSSVWVLADVFERDIRHIRAGLTADVSTAAYPDRRFRARVSRIHDTVDLESRTLKVRFVVDNPEGRLKPEMFANVSLFLSESDPATAVSPAAVFTEAGADYVYVRQGDSRLLRRQIESGGELAGRLRVTHGLQPGETVVTRGVLLVRQLEQNRTNND